MATLSELISRRITPEVKVPNKPGIKPVSAPLPTNSDNAAYKYEAEVFNFLRDHKEALGIKTIFKLTAVIVDGAVELLDGKRLTLEIKLRMNWKKACQAEWQFRTFLRRHTTVTGPVNGGLVLFEEFLGDGWERQAARRRLEDGWSEWYRNHAEVDGFRLDLLRIRKGKLEGFPILDNLSQQNSKNLRQALDPIRKRGGSPASDVLADLAKVLEEDPRWEVVARARQRIDFVPKAWLEWLPPLALKTASRSWIYVRVELRARDGRQTLDSFVDVERMRDPAKRKAIVTKLLEKSPACGFNPRKSPAKEVKNNQSRIAAGEHILEWSEDDDPESNVIRKAVKKTLDDLYPKLGKLELVLKPLCRLPASGT